MVYGNTSSKISSSIKKNSSSMMGKMGAKKALSKRSTCKGINDPCVKNGTIGAQLTKLIKQ